MEELQRMDRGRCKYCGHLLDATSDNRDMSQDVIGHGRDIVQTLVREGIRSTDICNFCYAHISMFKKECPNEYEQLKKKI